MIRRVPTPAIGNGPELTPLIDIVFIVVVFLLLTANIPILSLPVDIPDTDSQLANPTVNKHTLNVAVKASSPHWLLDVQGSGTYEYEDWKDFKGSLITQLNKTESSLLISAESQASAEKLLQLLALLNELAFSDVQILMEPRS